MSQGRLFHSRRCHQYQRVLPPADVDAFGTDHIQHFFCSFGQDIDVVDVCSLQSQRVQFIAHCRDIEDKGKSEHLLLFLIFTIFTTTARQLSFFIQ